MEITFIVSKKSVSSAHITQSAINMFKVNNRNTRTRCEICTKVNNSATPCSSVSIANFEQVNPDWEKGF